MNTYDKELIKYFKWLEEKSDIINNLTYNNQESYYLINNPKSIKEINTAKAIISILEDAKELVTIIEEYEVIPIEENKVVKLYIDIIKRLKNNEPYIDLINSINTEPKTFAEIMYNLYQATNYYDEIYNYISTNCGYDFLDDEFIDYFQRANSILNPQINYSYSAKNAERIIETYNEFHKICIKSKNEKQLKKVKYNIN